MCAVNQNHHQSCLILIIKIIIIEYLSCLILGNQAQKRIKTKGSVSPKNDRQYSSCQLMGTNSNQCLFSWHAA